MQIPAPAFRAMPDKPTWAAHREEIKQALAQILPKIQESKRYSDANNKRLEGLRLKGASSTKLRSLERKLERDSGERTQR